MNSSYSFGSFKMPRLMRFAGLGLMIVLLASLVGCSAFSASANRHDSPSEYYLYIPANAKEGPETRVFVGIHGEGGSGSDCWSAWQSYAQKEGFVLICPSLADQNGGWFQDAGEAKLQNILNAVLSEHKFNARVYLAGFSAGAQFVQGFASNYPNNTAGVAVLSAANYYSPAPASQGVPYLVVIGENDNSASVYAAQDYKVALDQSGIKTQFTLLAGVGHELSDEAKDLTIAHFKEATK